MPYSVHLSPDTVKSEVLIAEATLKTNSRGTTHFMAIEDSLRHPIGSPLSRNITKAFYWVPNTNRSTATRTRPRHKSFWKFTSTTVISMRLFLFLVLALIHMCVSAREISYFLIQGEMCMEAKFEHNCSLYMSLVLSEGSCKSRGYFVKSQFHEQFRLPFLGDVTMDLYYEPEFEGKYKSSSNTNTTMLFMAHETLCVEATINTKYPADFIVSLYPALSYGTCKGHGFSNSSSFYEGSYSIPVFGNMELSVRMKPDTFVDNKKRADETTTLFVTRYGVCAQLVLASNAVPVLGHFEHIMSEGACASQGYTATVEHYNLATVVGPVVLDVFKQNNAFDERTGDTTTSMYVVRFGVCAQLVLDTKAVPVLEHFEHILSEGTCASQGYTASVEHYNLTTVIGPVVLDVFKRDNTRVPLVSTAALKKHPA